MRGVRLWLVWQQVPGSDVKQFVLPAVVSCLLWWLLGILFRSSPLRYAVWHEHSTFPECHVYDAFRTYASVVSAFSQFLGQDVTHRKLSLPLSSFPRPRQSGEKYNVGFVCTVRANPVDSAFSASAVVRWFYKESGRN